MPKVNLTKQLIDNFDSKKNEQVFFDTKITGLHLKFQLGKIFYLYFRTKCGEQKRPKLGEFGIITIEQARDLSRVMLGNFQGQ